MSKNPIFRRGGRILDRGSPEELFIKYHTACIEAIFLELCTKVECCTCIPSLRIETIFLELCTKVVLTIFLELCTKVEYCT